MKIFKLALLTFSVAFFGCTSDNGNEGSAKPELTTQQRSSNGYTVEEVIKGMRVWDTLRNNTDQLLTLFNNANSLNVNMQLFPEGNALHAYACVLEGQLKFAVISEVYDNVSYADSLSKYIHVFDVVYSDVSNINQETYPVYTHSLPSQYIQATDALNRITAWNTSYSSWLGTSLPMYQLFYIPTHSLAPQNYTVYLGLKDSESQPDIKVADLVLKSNDSFYDTVLLQPPYRDRTKNYLLDLL